MERSGKRVFYFGRDMLKVFRDTVFYDALESLFKKVKTTLPPESLGYLEKVEQVLYLGMKPYKEYGKFKEIINRVHEAALNRKSNTMSEYQYYEFLAIKKEAMASDSERRAYASERKPGPLCHPGLFLSRTDDLFPG